MNIELINTGSELMLGLVLNTHQQWMCRQLADLGYVVTRQVAVADSAFEIQQAVREALTRADLILVTGGLGPTSDDLTRELIAELLGKKLQLDPMIQAHIEGFFAARRRPMPARAHVQAMVPDGASVLPNPNGTAPGLAMEVLPGSPGGASRTAWLVLLPGPPRELRPMFRDHAIPLIQKEFPLTEMVVCRTLKTTGIGESMVEEKIAGLLKTLTDGGLELGYCARIGEVDVRLIARGVAAPRIVDQAERIIRDQLGPAVFGGNDDQLEAVVIRLLTERRQTLSVAESCTGGHIANRLTNVPGASAGFLSGLVTYSNEAKERLLGVRAETLAAQGAVSEATVREMAEGARRRNKTDFALATTGIAGPTGGSPQKPVGTVFIALATADGTVARQHLNAYDRETFKFVTSQQALELLRRRLIARP
ncbi:MAG: competence/damage-inducible protein A [Limisphaerales bacterium]